MSDLLLGIYNQNEFFSEHYLAAILGGDLKPILGRWRDEAAAAKAAGAKTPRTPPQALAALQKEFFACRERLGRERAEGERIALHRAFSSALLRVLGYAPEAGWVSLPSGHLPLLAAISRPDGSPVLWFLPAVGPHSAADVDEAESPTLSRRLLAAHLAALPDEFARTPPCPRKGRNGRIPPLAESEAEAHPISPLPLEEIAGEAFNADEAPAYIVVCGEADVVLLERGKWPERRLLRFDLAEILGRRELPTLEATAVLLHRECLAPGAGRPVIEVLDESSHKHAYEVSEDLKYALQASIERLDRKSVV